MFYLARAIDAGEDPVFLARRIVVAASEDVGMANPMALVLANSALQAVHAVRYARGKDNTCTCGNLCSGIEKVELCIFSYRKGFRRCGNKRYRNYTNAY